MQKIKNHREANLAYEKGVEFHKEFIRAKMKEIGERKLERIVSDKLAITIGHRHFSRAIERNSIEAIVRLSNQIYEALKK